MAKAEIDPSKVEATGGNARVSDIAAELKAGKITAGAALDKVIARVLDRQLGPRAPVAMREKVGAALRDALADDPLLASKVRLLDKD